MPARWLTIALARIRALADCIVISFHEDKDQNDEDDG